MIFYLQVTLFSGDSLKGKLEYFGLVSLYWHFCLADFFSYGRWYSSCGTTFLFSTNNVGTWTKIYVLIHSIVNYVFFYRTHGQVPWEYADRLEWIGMELLAVEYDDKDLCIAKLAGSKYSDIVIYLLFWALAKKRWYFLLVILNN